MNKSQILKLFYRFFIVTLPIFVIILVNIAAEAHFRNFCIIKLLTGHECWGCGLTRAFAALSRFHFQEAYNFNHLIVIFAPLLFIIWVVLIKKEFSQKVI